jgi:hypothetical protein
MVSRAKAKSLARMQSGLHGKSGEDKMPPMIDEHLDVPLRSAIIKSALAKRCTRPGSLVI